MEEQVTNETEALKNLEEFGFPGVNWNGCETGSARSPRATVPVT